MAQRNALVYSRVWRGSIFTSFLQPLLFLLAMGLGLGGLIDADGAALPGQVSYLHFIAPGLLAATCMQTATFESSFPIMGKITWRRNYEAILATPMRVVDVVAGELLWIGVRLSMVAVAFTIVLVAFGVPQSVFVVLAVPGAVLTGLAFSAPILAYAATLESSSNFNILFRFVITPLFLFSGVFFPIARLPEPLQVVAWCTPLFHGVELVRGLVLGTIGPSTAAIHVTYLAVMLAGGTAAARVTFARKLRR